MGDFARWGRGDGVSTGVPTGSAAADPVMPASVDAAPPASVTDEQAIERYRYLLRTAPPETIEQAHAEAFARLTPGQRRKVLQELGADVPEAERSAVERAGASPEALARAATRAEFRRPGVMERMFGSAGAPGAGPGIGAVMGGTLLSGMAGAVLGSMMARQFFDRLPEDDRPFDRGDGRHDAAGMVRDPWSDAPADADTSAEVNDTGILADADDGFEGFDDGSGFFDA